MAANNRQLSETTTIEGNVYYPISFQNNTTESTLSEKDSEQALFNRKTDEQKKYIYDCINRDYNYQRIYEIFRNSSVKISSPKGGDTMSEVNWQEKYLDSLDSNIKEIKDGLVQTEGRISDIVSKHIEYSTHLDKQRHDEYLNINNKIDSSLASINDKIDSTNKWIIGLIFTTILSIAALVLTAIS